MRVVVLPRARSLRQHVIGRVRVGFRTKDVLSAFDIISTIINIVLTFAFAVSEYEEQRSIPMFNW